MSIRKLHLIVWIFLSLLVVNTVFGATIEGRVYDSLLNPASDVAVTIYTTPKQVYITKNGTYSFNVPDGNYTIKAEQYKNKILIAEDEDIIVVKSSGKYHLDLLLFDSLKEEESLGNISVIDEGVIIDAENESLSNFWVYGIFILLIGFICLVIYFVFFKNKLSFENKVLEDADLENIVIFIKKHKRITQKEIRKNFFLSEAKISLILTELEDKGIIKKIKKGRGNIILYQK